MSKKYYSPIKPYTTRKKRYPFFNLFKKTVKLFFPDDEIIWMTEKPQEPVLFVCNHTKIYAPISFILNWKSKPRLWANAYFISMKEIKNHLIKKVLANRKFLKPLGYLLMPLIVHVFRALEPIPVYHDMRVKDTMVKAIFTLNEGKDMVIFPERTENPVNKYIFEFNRGFPMVAQAYYRETGKKLKFYPVYCCKDLHKFLIGDPIEYNPDIELKEQRDIICAYLENKICELADSLPEHKIEIYG